MEAKRMYREKKQVILDCRSRIGYKSMNKPSN